MASKNKKKKAIATHKVTEEEIKESPELSAAGVQAGDTVEMNVAADEEIEDGVPTFTLRADSIFGLRAMIVISRMARSEGYPEASEVEKAMRDFDLYEEANRE